MTFDLAEHIRQTREALGWTQAELARRSDVDQGDLSRIERHQTDPRWSTVTRILDAFGEAVPIGASVTHMTQRSSETRALQREIAEKTSLNRKRPSSLLIKH